MNGIFRAYRRPVMNSTKNESAANYQADCSPGAIRRRAGSSCGPIGSTGTTSAAFRAAVMRTGKSIPNTTGFANWPEMEPRRLVMSLERILLDQHVQRARVTGKAFRIVVHR